MNILNKVSTKIIIAAVFGLLFAIVFTNIQQPCTTAVPGEDIAHCIAWSKAVLHPSELLNNRQGSLVGFVETVAIVSAAGYALLSIDNRIQTKRSKQEHNIK